MACRLQMTYKKTGKIKMFSNVRSCFFCKSVKTKHQRCLAPISGGKFHRISSVLTSSKDDNFPTLGFLSFITSCFTSARCSAFNKLLMRKTNINTLTAPHGGSDFHVCDKRSLPWQRLPRSLHANEAAVNLSRSLLS